MSAFHVTRDCDGRRCCICSAVIERDEDGATVTVPSKRLGRLSAKTKQKFVIKWDVSKLVNFFHLKCWERVTMSPANLMPTEERLLNSVADTVEKFSCGASIMQQIPTVVDMIMEAKRVVVFTGSGVSASAGIPTYRGSTGIDTLTSFASNDKPAAGVDVGESHELATAAAAGEFSDYTALHPTYTHYAVKELHDLDKLNGCFTQNCDNLHAKAGLPWSAISDLHGNVFIEYCEKCLTEYVRDYAVDAYSTDCHNEPYYRECPSCKWNHYTGRRCDNRRCNGKLRDTIVNFGDDLHQLICGGYWKASRKCRHADLCLCLGSSLTVPPASELPLKSKKLVIVNLQDTDLDEDADVRLWTTSDDFFRLLMPQLRAALGCAEPVVDSTATSSHSSSSSSSSSSSRNRSGGAHKKRRTECKVIDLTGDVESD